MKITLSGKPTPHILRVFTLKKPANVTLDGTILIEGDSWMFDSDRHRLSIKSRSGLGRSYEISWR